MPSGSRAFEPRAVVDSNDVIHLVYPGGVDPASTWQANYRYYNGSTWSSPIVIPGSGYGVSSVDIAVDGSDNLHVVWHGYSNPEEVYYCKRTGSTWGSVTNLSNTGSTRSLYPRIAVNPAGTEIMVTWHEHGQVGATYDIFAKKYSGGSWGSNTNLSNDSGVSSDPQITIDGSGNFYVCWQDGTDKKSYFRKHNTSGTWESEVRIDNSSNRAFGPDVIVDSTGLIHFAWHDDTSGEWEIYYRNRNGSSWGSIANISNHTGVTDAYADIQVDSNNNLHVVYHDYDDIWYAWCYSGAWQTPVKISDTSSQNSPVLVITSSGEEHCFWQHNGGGNWNIWWSWQNLPTAPTPPAYGASLVSISAPSTMAAGSTATVTVTFNNIGSSTWNSNTKLGTSSPRDRSSPFYNSADWPSANRPTILDQTSVGSGSNGTFTFIAKAPNTPGNYSEKFELVQEAVTWFNGTGDDITWNVTVTAVPGAITGTVTSGGSPVSGATVSTNTGGYSTTTNGSGQYTLSNVTPGTYTVTASKSGYVSSNIPGVVVTSGATTSNVNFSLTVQPGTISGTITSTLGGPVSGATVATNTGGYSTTTNGSGQYTLSNVAPGTYTVTASHTNYNSANQTNVNVSSGATTTVNLSLVPKPGSITGTVTSGGSPLSGVTVSTNTGGYSTTTNGSGQYTLSNVTPGTYSVTASKTGYTPSVANNVTVNPNAATTQNFTLSVSTPTDYIENGNMEGGFWSTGWGGGSAIPNDWDGWYNPGDFNCFQESSIKHGGSYSAKTTISSGGNAGSGGYKRGIVQYVELPPNTSFTITVWARHTNGNCPSIMCWNPGEDANPETAAANGRYQWVTTDNWGELNTWVSRSMTGTSPSSGIITVIVGGAHHGGGGSGTIYIDDVTVVSPSP